MTCIETSLFSAYKDLRHSVTFFKARGFAPARVFGLGLLLAAFSTRRILGLESETARQFREVQQLSARLVEAQERE